MIDDLYVLARLSELSRAVAQIAAERKALAAIASAPAHARAGASVSDGLACPAPLATA